MYHDGGNFTEGYMIGRDNNNGGAFGNNGDWGWFIILALLFGWGGNGFGGFGNGGAGMTGYELGKVATTNDVASGFNNSAVLSSLNDLKLGQAGLQQTLCQGFNGINTTVLTSANSLQAQLAECCCQTQRAIDGVNFNNAQNTCQIVNAIHAEGNATRDLITQNKIETLQAKLADKDRDILSRDFQLSQLSQNNYLVNRLAPCPIPAYMVANPNCCYNPCGCSGSQFV